MKNGYYFFHKTIVDFVDIRQTHITHITQTNNCVSILSSPRGAESKNYKRLNCMMNLSLDGSKLGFITFHPTHTYI